MRIKMICITLLFIGKLCQAQSTENSPASRIVSEIDSITTDGLVLKQTFVVNAPLHDVWEAYTTEKGWESWAAAIAEIDFRKNGTILTNYNKHGKIGDSTTITLHVLDYVPKQMLRLQAELTENFPSFMKDDEKQLYNEIFFEEISPKKTRVTSYGIGYKNNEKYKSLMKFFIQGNEQSLQNLIEYLESGKPSVKY